MSSVIAMAIVGPMIVSLMLTVIVRRAALRRGFFDYPGGHKQHATPVALGGGVVLTAVPCAVILLGTALAWLLRDGAPPAWVPGFVQLHLEGIASRLSLVAGIVVGAIVLHVVGLIDDRKPLGPWTKFAFQFAVAIFAAWPMGIRVLEALPAPASILLTVLWIVLITNAFNFLDNMDGLSAGVAAIAAAIFAVASMQAGQVFVPIMAWVLVGTLLGFLPFNFSPARIFMGDAGSLVIGYLMALLPILVTFYDPGQHDKPFGLLVPLLVLAVPLYDVVSVVTHRLRAGHSPLKGDRRHFSHRLVHRGMTTRGAVCTIYLATAATGLPAILLPHLDWPGAILLVAQCLCVLTIIAILEHAGGVNRVDQRP